MNKLEFRKQLVNKGGQTKEADDIVQWIKEREGEIEDGDMW